MKVTSLRSKGFSIVNLRGYSFEIAHKQPFTVNTTNARYVANIDKYMLRIKGQTDIDFPYTVKLAVK